MATGTRDLHTEELRARIRWLIRLRWLAALGVAIVVYAAPKLFLVSLPSDELYAVTLALVLYNYLLWKLADRYGESAPEAAVFWFANVQVSADLVFLTLLLHFSGGIENPFVCYYVFHVVIASILLAPHIAFLQVGLAVALLLGMTVGEAAGLLRHYHLFTMWSFEPYRDSTYLAAILFVTVTMLYFTALMATTISSRLRRREREITDLSASVQKHAEDLERAYGSLRELEREKSEYMYRAAHHLRAPLAAVENMLAVVAEGRTGAIPGQAEEMVARSRARVRGMLELAPRFAGAVPRPGHRGTGTPGTGGSGRGGSGLRTRIRRASGGRGRDLGGELCAGGEGAWRARGAGGVARKPPLQRDQVHAGRGETWSCGSRSGRIGSSFAFPIPVSAFQSRRRPRCSKSSSAPTTRGS